MWECRASNLASEGALQATNLVFEVLSLLTQGTAFVLWWPHGLDGVSDALYLVGKAVADYREVWWQGAIVVDQ
jgi:hypothetical protein